MSLTVVKVGGSFASHPDLPALAAALAEGAGRAVIVPGGGPFADAVRAEQKRIGFDDRAAHRMALLAMAQFGYALASLSAALVPVEGNDAVQGALRDRLAPVWLPLDLLDGHPDVPENWSVTSDSLAAWLAEKLGADRILFLKRDEAAPTALATLVAGGILDPLTPRFLAAAKAEAWLCGPDDLPLLGRALFSCDPIGRRIEVA